MAKAKQLCVELLAFTDLLTKGGDSTEAVEPKPDDQAYTMYTSGTTARQLKMYLGASRWYVECMGGLLPTRDVLVLCDV